MEGRACHGLELSPAYCDVIIKRWQDFTGDDAVLESDGRAFCQVADGISAEEAEHAEA